MSAVPAIGSRRGTVKILPFLCSLLISTTIHTLFLWHWSLTLGRESPAPAIFTTQLHARSPLPSDGKPSAPENEGRMRSLPQQQQKLSPPRDKTDQSNPSAATGERSSSATGVTAPQANGEGSASTGIGGPAPGGGAGTGTGGKFSGQQGNGPSTPGKPGAGGKDGSTGTAPSTASTPIPEPPPHLYRYRFSASYFVKVDHYVLEGMNIPGTELCIAGDQLRTRGAITITQLMTDRSKCRVRTRGDEEKEICPPEAKSEVVAFQGILSSPINYRVNTCLEYDKSHCRVIRRGTDQEREYCKVNFKYEGVWAEGTIVDYKCTKSEIVTYSHPLEYNIRYMVEIARNDDDRIRSREVYRVKQSIPQC
jgi:hypothetical protein